MDKINKANQEEMAKADHEQECQRWDNEIMAERTAIFLAGAVAGVMCAIAVVVMK